jgi:hypothetical protein
MEKLFNNKSQKIKEEENKVEKSQIREGVDFVFEKNTELIKVGTKQQYLEYLDKVFPNSVINNILYRGDKIKLDLPQTSDNNDYGIYLTKKMNLAFRYGDRITTSLINTINPYYTNDAPGMYWKWIIDKSSRFYEYDSVVLDNGQEIIVSPKQIYILGSEQDINNFKSFVKNYPDSFA